MSLAFFATAAISAGQAILLVAVLGEGERTDAFLGAYAVFLPVALLASTLRAQLIPQFGSADADEAFRARAADVAARASLVGMVLAFALLVTAPLTARFVTRGLSGEAQRTAVLVLAVLAPAAGLQFRATALAAILGAAQRFERSAAFFVGSALAALAISAALLPLLGPAGAALGLVCGSVLLVVAHERYLRRLGVRLRVRAGWLRQRRLWLLAGGLVAYAAMGQAQQLNLALAASEVSAEPVNITIYTYAFFLVSLILNVTSVALGLVLLPRLVTRLRDKGRKAVADHVARVCTTTFVLVAPVLAGLVLLGRPLLRAVLSPILSRASIDLVYETSAILSAYAIAAAVLQALVFALLALRRWDVTAGGAVLWLVVTAVAIGVFADGKLPATAVAHSIATFVVMIAMLAAVFRRGAGRIALRLAVAVAPPLALAGLSMAPAVALGVADGVAGSVAGLAVGAPAYVALLRLLRPQLLGDVRGWAKQMRS